jgi:phosphate transport system substrate-binding protein
MKPPVPTHHRLNSLGLRDKFVKILRSIVVFALLTVTLLPAMPARAAALTLVESGSTLFYPLFRIWTAQYAKANSGVRITARGTGSEAGVKDAIAGTAQIGASDAFMSDEQLKANPDILNIPLAIGAETVNYNLPGLNKVNVRLDGPTVAGIYTGSIRFWDAKPIATLNPDLRLPHHTIIPIHRRDGSGTTFVFTQYLTFSTPTWENGPNYGTTIAWPNVPGSIDAAGNPGMIETTKITPYSIAYIGTSLHDQIAKAGIGTALIGNQAGKFLLPTTDTVRAGAAALDSRTPPDERLSLVYAPGENSYPLIGYEYAIVSTKQPNPSVAAAIRGFLTWSIDSSRGSSPKNMNAVRFIPLPEYIRALSILQIEKIQ